MICLVGEPGAGKSSLSWQLAADVARQAGDPVLQLLDPTDDLPSRAKALFEALREWRLGEAKRAGVPAFRIMNDRTLLGVATETPNDEGALLRVAGIGPGVARRYGAALLGIVSRYADR